ncbi:hypothetical protein DSO57_1004126 [Entomophthora muscae]|uniref:Uncharacterized protein n=2 Tax=Entomophthora muscae TaxID=34485 RepID=A0ACC2TJL0_9FUNG|nr:hypothetical protein DSO57_1016534 [Entomophthora muscae]KAJ9074676.1 hypothetical protein DSO57_1004126 [Entomophthora muscae]
MITDDQLSLAVNLAGSFVMTLIFLHHLIVVNSNLGSKEVFTDTITKPVKKTS